MTWLPTHEFGLLNAWIAVVLYLIPMLLTVTKTRGVFRKTVSVFSVSRTRAEYAFFVGSKLLMLVFFLYSILVPVAIHTGWAAAGAAVFLLGYTSYVGTWISIATAPRDKVFTGGLYRYSRHPIYVSSAVVFVGTGLASASVVYLALAVLVGISHLSHAYTEERICLSVFGDDYRDYAARTPRWFGLPRPG